MFNFRILSIGFLLLSIVSCKNEKQAEEDKNDIQTEKAKEAFKNNSFDFVVAFGSCNKQNHEQPLWNAMAEQNPDIFIWGGDNIYADTEDMTKMAQDYQTQLENPNYKAFLKTIDHQVYGTWDDHDFGKNDAGKEWAYKVESQDLFLDFIGVDSTDVRRSRKGIYHAEDIEVEDKTIKLILLDTRYFRSPLQDHKESKKRYKPWQNGEGTLLGEAQWSWFENELASSTADFHIIVSSIQIWSNEHGFETWGNFPHEVDKLKKLLNNYQPKNIVMLSGDRHISEFSSQNLEAYEYPIFDFTSSGLTHAYSGFTSEPNTDRVGEVVSTESFGLLKYNFENNSVLMEMRNLDRVLQAYELGF
ncbi:alkaline phosphatase D family protein [Flavobacteriaceae bacterium 14752]|uniref:alkaline phosphatase D family protein n=1 Tax=Mesohalobacter salilacus TaxID=2491711 RepID=UPI000F62E291|nr:alkaline phosphatase family protein [Flavobacteriaceae bacterium 14752]